MAPRQTSRSFSFARSAALAGFLTALALVGMARAQESDRATAQIQNNAPGVYHVLDVTVACADPRGTHALTNPDDRRRANPAWVKSTYRNANCITVTPISPWALVRRDGPLALMAYIGANGAPGAYWFEASQLVDSGGAHLSAPAMAGPGASESGPTALAPPPIAGMSDAGPNPIPAAGRNLLFLWAGVALLIAAAVAAYLFRRRRARP